MPKAMPSSFRFNALCFVCILVAKLKVVVSFLPVPAATAQDVLNLQGHPLQVRLPPAGIRMCVWGAFYQIPGIIRTSTWYATTRADHDHDTTVIWTVFFLEQVVLHCCVLL